MKFTLTISGCHLRKSVTSVAINYFINRIISDKA